MGNSGSSKNRVTAQDKAILDLKTQRDKLQQYQKRIVVLTDRETEIAKECLRKNDKQRALLALRRKKYQESLLSKTDAQLAQLEQLTNDVEFALVQKDVMYGLQQGTAVLKAIHAEMGGIAAVEKLMGESEDAMAYQREVSELLAGQISTAEEEEVEDELAALQAELEPITTNKMASSQRVTGNPVALPDVPAGEVRGSSNEDVESEERATKNEPMLAS